MNCFEFRRQSIAEPRSTSDAYRRHRAECAACAAFALRQENFERALTKALGIEVPRDLGARVILRQTTRHSFSLRRTLAYAASMLLILGIAAGLLWPPRAPDIGNLVMDHILEEPEYLVAKEEVPRERAVAVMAQEGVTLRGDLGVIRFVGRCPGRSGVHMVLAGREGPVTVMIMPAMPVSSRQVLARGSFTGVLRPIGKGSLAVVGLPGEPIDEHEQRVRAAISQAAS